MYVCMYVYIHTYVGTSKYVNTYRHSRTLVLNRHEEETPPAAHAVPVYSNAQIAQGCTTYTHTYANHTAGTNMIAPILFYDVQISTCPNISTCVLWFERLRPKDRFFSYPIKYTVPVYLQEGYPYWYMTTPNNKEFAALQSEVIQVRVCVCVYCCACKCIYWNLSGLPFV